MFKTLIATAIIAAGIGAAPADAASRSSAKAPIVLVHGAFEDNAVWRAVTAGLRADGYRAVTVDLPGRPSNPLAVQQISLSTYRAAVRKVVDAQRGPVVLVGHSFGGIVISDVANDAPAKVRTLVYVAALLPHDGDSLLSMAQSDPGSQVGAHLQVRKDEGLASIPADARADLFANDGNADQRAIVTQALVDEPLAPLAEPVHLAPAFAAVDKVYVRTAQDHVVSPEAQSAMLSGTPVRKIIDLNTGHTPFLTDPAGLVRAIEDATR